jgi:hypothetical protein
MLLQTELFSCSLIQMMTLFEMLQLFQPKWNFIELARSINWDIIPSYRLKIKERFGELVSSIFSVKIYSEELALLASCFHAGFLLRLFSVAED